MYAVLYFLLRSGLHKEVLLYLEQHQHAFDQDQAGFTDALKRYIENNLSLPIESRRRVQAIFYNDLKHQTETEDPFKIILFKIIGRCDLSHRSVSSIIQTTEDYIWLQLMLISEDVSSSATFDVEEDYRLVDLQTLMRRYGAEHFSKNGSGNIVHYAEVFLLTAQFTEAVQFLLKVQGLFVDAVHFAIALFYYGLLDVSSESSFESKIEK